MVHYRSYITTFIYINVLHSAMFSQSRRVTDRKMLTSFPFPSTSVFAISPLSFLLTFSLLMNMFK